MDNSEKVPYRHPLDSSKAPDSSSIFVKDISIQQKITSLLN